MPAKAGIHLVARWTPAFAGVTKGGERSEFQASKAPGVPPDHSRKKLAISHS